MLFFFFFCVSMHKNLFFACLALPLSPSLLLVECQSCSLTENLEEPSRRNLFVVLVVLRLPFFSPLILNRAGLAVVAEAMQHSGTSWTASDQHQTSPDRFAFSPTHSLPQGTDCCSSRPQQRTQIFFFKCFFSSI